MKNSAQKSIQEFYGQWFGAMEQADIDGFITLLADNFYIKTSGKPAITDAAELRKSLKQYHQMFKSTVDWEIEKMQFFENHAVVRFIENVTLINRQTEDTSKYSGVHLALLEKQADGKWKATTDISSLNDPVLDNAQPTE